MNKAEIWEFISALTFTTGIWISLSGVSLMLVSYMMHGLGVPGRE